MDLLSLMRVGIDATCWSNRRGYGRFTRGLTNALLDAKTAHEFVLFIDAQTYTQSQLPAGATWVVVPTVQPPTQAAAASSRRSLRDLWAMTAAVARCSLDVLFFPSVYTYFPAPTRGAIILGVHDVIAEEYPDLVFPDRRRRQLWTLKGRLAHYQADYILTVSEYAKGGIVRHFRHTPERVWVVEEAPDTIFRPLAPDEIDQAVLRCYGIAPADRFFLYLGGVNPHKNLVTLLEALAALCCQPGYKDVRLVIVGDIQTDVFTPGFAEVHARIAALGLAERVCVTGFLSDVDVLQFLNVAQALVLPSMAEGFGLPAVEAAACGTPVIATWNSPLPQLLAGGGLFFDPTQPSQLTQALGQILRDKEERQRLGQIALERAQELTWQRSAGQMQDLLATVERARR